MSRDAFITAFIVGSVTVAWGTTLFAMQVWPYAPWAVTGIIPIGAAITFSLLAIALEISQEECEGE